MKLLLVSQFILLSFAVIDVSAAFVTAEGRPRTNTRKTPAFIVGSPPFSFSSSALSVGGKGWENSGYLDSLGGDADDREKAQEDYQEFHQSRQEFLQRQQQRLDSPEGQRFLQQQQQQNQGDRGRSWLDGDDEEEESNEQGMDEYLDIGESSGGSRLRNMMQQAKKKAPTGENPSGLEQRFIVPLDEEDWKHDKWTTLEL